MSCRAHTHTHTHTKHVYMSVIKCTLTVLMWSNHRAILCINENGKLKEWKKKCAGILDEPAIEVQIRVKIRMLPLVVFIDMFKQLYGQLSQCRCACKHTHPLIPTHVWKTHEKLIIPRYKLVSVCTIWLIKNYLGCVSICQWF